MAKRRRQSQKPARTCTRARAVSHTFFLSADESLMFREKAAARGCTLSDLLRHWISLQPRTRTKPPISEPDPRQAILPALLRLAAEGQPSS